MIKIINENLITNVKSITILLSKNRKLVLVLFFIIIVVVSIIFVVNKNQNKENVPPESAPKPTLPPPTTNDAFFINQLTNSKNSVNSTCWFENSLYYSTNNGVFDAKNNISLTNDKIFNPKCNRTGILIYFDGNGWKTINLRSKTTNSVVATLFYPNLSPDGKFIADIKGRELTLFETNDFKSSNRSFSSNISRTFWSENSNYVAISRLENNKSVVELFNTKLEQQGKTEFDSQVELLALSPDADRMLVKDSENIKIIDENNKTINLNIDQGSKINALWFNELAVLLQETRLENTGREINYFWYYNNNILEYLSNSLPIPGRINTSIPLEINKDLSVVSLVENNGKIWLLSLIKGKMAFYDNSGLRFIDMSSKGGEVNYP